MARDIPSCLSVEDSNVPRFDIKYIVEKFKEFIALLLLSEMRDRDSQSNSEAASTDSLPQPQPPSRSQSPSIVLPTAPAQREYEGARSAGAGAFKGGREIGYAYSINSNTNSYCTSDITPTLPTPRPPTHSPTALPRSHSESPRQSAELKPVTNESATREGTLRPLRLRPTTIVDARRTTSRVSRVPGHAMDLGEGDLLPHAQDARSTRNSTRDGSAPSLSERKLPSRSCSHDVGINTVGISLPTDRLTRPLSVDQNHGAPPPYASNVYAGAGTQDRIGVFEGEEDATARYEYSIDSNTNSFCASDTTPTLPTPRPRLDSRQLAAASPKHTEREKQPREGPRPLVLQSSHTAIKRAASRSPTVPARTPELYKGDSCPSIHITRPSSDSDREIGPQERAPVLHGDYPCSPSPHANDCQGDNHSTPHMRSTRESNGSIPSPSERKSFHRSYGHDVGLNAFGVCLPNDWLTRATSVDRIHDKRPSGSLFDQENDEDGLVPGNHASNTRLSTRDEAIALPRRSHERSCLLHRPWESSDDQDNLSAYSPRFTHFLLISNSENHAPSRDLVSFQGGRDPTRISHTRLTRQPAYNGPVPSSSERIRSSRPHSRDRDPDTPGTHPPDDWLARVPNINEAREQRSDGNAYALKARLFTPATPSPTEYDSSYTLHREWQAIARETCIFGSRKPSPRPSTNDRPESDSESRINGSCAFKTRFDDFVSFSIDEQGLPPSLHYEWQSVDRQARAIGTDASETCLSSRDEVPRSSNGHGAGTYASNASFTGYNDPSHTDSVSDSQPLRANAFYAHSTAHGELFTQKDGGHAGALDIRASNTRLSAHADSSAPSGFGNESANSLRGIRRCVDRENDVNHDVLSFLRRGRDIIVLTAHHDELSSQTSNGEDDRKNRLPGTHELNESSPTRGDHDDDAGWQIVRTRKRSKCSRLTLGRQNDAWHRSATLTCVLVSGTDASLTRLSAHDDPVASTISDHEATYSLQDAWRSVHRGNGFKNTVLDFYGGRNPVRGVDGHQNAENESSTCKTTNDDGGQSSSLCLAGRSPRRDNGFPRAPHSSQVAYTPHIEPSDQDNDVEKRLVNSHDRDRGAPSSSAGVSGELRYSLHGMGQPIDKENGISNDVLKSTAHGDDVVALGHSAFNTRPSAHDDPVSSTILNGKLSNSLRNAWQAVDGVDHAVSDFSQGGRDPADRTAFIETAHFGGGIVITVRGRATAPL
ncbi:hypothetical protein BOTBODRAFT_182134 [Botryobasidium botryosum FD-172 SS1]|uniref:Uncharacterized protein n=1 Tax=Botryobasidium botryosum (strain FD-172 SS1) TaxID=930990 RepID=A0A067M216_BOTB1|nr:hypothetical protein BOTBODRAFT_182134 [Botryobasidium botryosum FD-172 SS1]